MSMALTSILDQLQVLISSDLADWNVIKNEISYPQDKLVELIYLDMNSQMVDFGTQAITGNIGIVFYKKFNSSYYDQLDAVESVVKLLKTVDISELAVGNNTSTQAIISSPSIANDGKVDYRVILVSVPFELVL